VRNRTLPPVDQCEQPAESEGRDQKRATGSGKHYCLEGVAAATRVSRHSRCAGTTRSETAHSDAAMSTVNVRTGDVRRFSVDPGGSTGSARPMPYARSWTAGAHRFHGAGKPKEDRNAAIIAHGMSRRASLWDMK